MAPFPTTSPYTIGSMKQTPIIGVYTKATNEANDRRGSFGLNSIDSSFNDFTECFLSNGPKNTNHGNVFSEGLAGTLKRYRVRSIAWKMYLGLLTPGRTPDEWVSDIALKRNEYDTLLKQYKTDPNNVDDIDPHLNNPLSQEAESPWTKFYAEQELIETIGKDTNRLYPVGCGEFFEHTKHATNGMTNVLFLWSQLHPDTSYRQGMHELLAPFVWLMESERLAGDTDEAPVNETKDPNDAGTAKNRNAMRQLLHPKYIEHDAFWMFTTMMKDVEQLFYVHTVDSRQLALKYRESQRMGATTLARRKRSSTDVALEAVTEARSKDVTPVLRTCNRIHHELLHVVDPPVHKRMVAMEIEPQLYCLPWVRLMFCRCFHVDDVLVLWEGIFSATSQVQLSKEPPPIARNDRITEMIECIGAAMVMFVREYLLEAESMYMLQRLMKYPPVEDVSVFVQRGVEIRGNPNKCFAPEANDIARQQETKRLQQEAAEAAAVAAAAAVNRASSSSSSSSSSFSSSAPSFQRPNMATGTIRSSQFQSQSPPPGSSSSTNTSSTSVQERMGMQIGYISKVFETELVGKAEGAPYDETIVLQALAQLKQVKDVLSNRIDEGDCFWLYSIKETATAAAAAEVDKEDAQQQQEQVEEAEQKQEQEQEKQQAPEQAPPPPQKKAPQEEPPQGSNVSLSDQEQEESQTTPTLLPQEEPMKSPTAAKVSDFGLFDDDDDDDETVEKSLMGGTSLFGETPSNNDGGLFGDDGSDDDSSRRGSGLFD